MARCGYGKLFIRSLKFLRHGFLLFLRDWWWVRLLKKKNLHTSNFFAVLTWSKLDVTFFVPVSEFPTGFSWTRRKRVRIWSKKNISYHCQQKKEKVLDCYQAVDMKIPEISGAGTKAGMHTQWEQRGWRRGETFSAKKLELTHPPLAAWWAPARGFDVCSSHHCPLDRRPHQGCCRHKWH